MLKAHKCLVALMLLTGCGLAPDLPMAPMQAAAKDEPVTVYGVQFVLSLLNEWDRDRSATLNLEEYVDGKQSGPWSEDPTDEDLQEIAEHARERFQALDSNHNGHLNLVELFPEYWNMPKPQLKPGMRAPEIKSRVIRALETFIACDADQSGFLHQEEFGTAGDSRKIFRKLDVDRNHVLTLGELLPEYVTPRN